MYKLGFLADTENILQISHVASVELFTNSLVLCTLTPHILISNITVQVTNNM